jgi:hypothetical protein
MIPGVAFYGTSKFRSPKEIQEMSERNSGVAGKNFRSCRSIS